MSSFISLFDSILFPKNIPKNVSFPPVFRLCFPSIHSLCHKIFTLVTFLCWFSSIMVLINYMTNVPLYLVVSYFEPLPPALHQFVIPAPILIPVLIWNPSCYYLNSLCPDLKSLPRFVIPLALICNPQKFFLLFRFFPLWYWNLNMNNFWFRDPNMMKLGRRYLWYDT